MSKLDTILQMYGVGETATPRLKNQIKSLLLELIGDDEAYPTPTHGSEWHQKGVNSEKKEIREKVNEL